MKIGGNLLVIQGGGPTPVLNASLYGVLDEAQRSGRFTQIFGARFGMKGLARGDFIDLTLLPQSEIERLRTTPGASLGSSRYKPTEEDLEPIIKRLRADDIRSIILIGGNGSLRGAAAI